MAPIKSLDELNKVRDEGLKKRKIQMESGEIKVIVGMGTSSIAVGAQDTLKEILAAIEANKLHGVAVIQTGGIGLDAKEPIVQVAIGTKPIVTYGNVTVDVASQIIKEHVAHGNIVEEHVVQI